jgi:glycosyltransferase involved in cell wall biosynthesis
VELGLDSKGIEIIYNWCDEDSILSKDNYDKSAIPWDLQKFTVLYTGNLGRAQALDAVLYAAKIIRDKYLNIQFVFVGAGVEADRLKKKAEKMNLDNVMFIPYKPASEIKRYMLAADALLVHLKDDPLFSITIPSKIQTYLAVGRPIIAGVRGDAAELIKESGAGVIVPPENPEELAKGIIKIADLRFEDRERMGKNGSAYYKNNLSFDLAVNKFERVFASAVKDKS